MKVEVLYFEGCPNHTATVQRVREALQSENETAVVQEVEVRTQGDAESMGFLGSPSVRINGLDIEPEARNPNSYGLSCRTYLDGAKRSGVPSRELTGTPDGSRHATRRQLLAGIAVPGR